MVRISNMNKKRWSRSPREKKSPRVATGAVVVPKHEAVTASASTAAEVSVAYSGKIGGDATSKQNESTMGAKTFGEAVLALQKSQQLEQEELEQEGRDEPDGSDQRQQGTQRQGSQQQEREALQPQAKSQPQSKLEAEGQEIEHPAAAAASAPAEKNSLLSRSRSASKFKTKLGIFKGLAGGHHHHHANKSTEKKVDKKAMVAPATIPMSTIGENTTIEEEEPSSNVAQGLPSSPKAQGEISSKASSKKLQGKDDVVKERMQELQRRGRKSTKKVRLAMPLRVGSATATITNPGDSLFVRGLASVDLAETVNFLPEIDRLCSPIEENCGPCATTCATRLCVQGSTSKTFESNDDDFVIRDDNTNVGGKSSVSGKTSFAGMKSAEGDDDFSADGTQYLTANMSFNKLDVQANGGDQARQTSSLWSLTTDLMCGPIDRLDQLITSGASACLCLDPLTGGQMVNSDPGARRFLHSDSAESSPKVTKTGSWPLTSRDAKSRSAAQKATEEQTARRRIMEAAVEEATKQAQETKNAEMRLLAQADELKWMRVNLDQENEVNRELNEQLARLRNEVATKLETENRRLITEKERALEEVRREKDQAATMANTMEERVEIEKMKYWDLNEQIMKLKLDVADAGQNHQQIDQVTTKAFDEAQQQSCLLKEQIKRDALGELVRLQQEATEEAKQYASTKIKTQTEELKELEKSEISQLKTKISVSEAKAAQQDVYHGRTLKVDEVQKAKQHAEAKIEALSNELKALEEKFEAESKQNSALESQLSGLRKELSKAKTDAQTTIDSQHEGLSRMEKVISVLEADIKKEKEMRGKESGAKSAKEISLQEEITVLKKERSQNVKAVSSVPGSEMGRRKVGWFRKLATGNAVDDDTVVTDYDSVMSKRKILNKGWVRPKKRACSVGTLESIDSTNAGTIIEEDDESIHEDDGTYQSSSYAATYSESLAETGTYESNIDAYGTKSDASSAGSNSSSIKYTTSNSSSVRRGALQGDIEQHDSSGSQTECTYSSETVGETVEDSSTTSSKGTGGIAKWFDRKFDAAAIALGGRDDITVDTANDGEKEAVNDQVNKNGWFGAVMGGADEEQEVVYDQVNKKGALLVM